MSIEISSTETADQIAAAQLAQAENAETSENTEDGGALGASAKEEGAKEASAEKPVEESKKKSEADNDEAGDDADEDGDEPSESSKAKGRTRNRIQKMRARAEAAERKVLEMEAKYGQKPEPTQEGAQSKDGRPNPDNFESEEDYQEALAEWRVDQKFAAREQKEKSQKLASDFQSRVLAHREKTAEFAKQHPDFKEVIESADDIVLSPILQDAILENGPEFMYELAKNPDELERINELSANEAARALGRIEERIAARAAQPKEEKKIQTKAPPPIATTRSGAGTGSHKSIFDEGLSFSEYEKLRSAQPQR